MTQNNNKLSNPPIKETFCSVDFSDDTIWDDVTPGLIYNMLRELEDYGFEEREDIEAYKIIEGGESEEPSFKKVERTIIKDQDKKRGVLILEQGISVNYLNGFYDSWDDYTKTIQLVISGVTDLIGEYSINSYKLGFLNEFELSSSDELETFFSFNPLLNKGYDIEKIRSFLQGVELEIEDPPGIVRSTLTNYQVEELHKINYELQFSSIDVDIKEIETLYPLLEGAHEEIENQFFGTINEELMKRYKE